MKIPIIQFGNSKGIRLSKTILKKYNIKGSVEISLAHDFIILKPTHAPREGWNQAFKVMHDRGDDKIIMPDILEDENLDECI